DWAARCRWPYPGRRTTFHRDDTRRRAMSEGRRRGRALPCLCLLRHRRMRAIADEIEIGGVHADARRRGVDGVIAVAAHDKSHVRAEEIACENELRGFFYRYEQSHRGVGLHQLTLRRPL